MQKLGECRIYEMCLTLCVLFVSLVGCQDVVVDTSTSSPFAEVVAPTFTPLPKTSAATAELATIAPLASAEPSQTPTLDVPTPMLDDARQLTTMRTGKPWWSKDGRMLYFSTIGSDSQTWMVDLTTNVIQPGSDSQFSFQEAVSLTVSLSPGQVFQDEIRISPSGDKIVFSYNVASMGPSEEMCDGEACKSIPAKGIGLIDLKDRQLTLLQMEGELIAMEISLRWSDDESRVVIGAPPSWTTGSDVPTVWIADLVAGRVYPIGTRDDRIYPLSISPNGDLLTYQLEEPGPNPACDMYLWTIDSQEDRFLPNLPCTAHFWLSNNRTVVFDEQVGDRIVFWAYDITTFERREIASSTELPRTHSWYALAPDERSVAVVLYSNDDSSGIWLVSFDLGAYPGES
jgi:Tol biopolymer transport system component